MLQLNRKSTQVVSNVHGEHVGRSFIHTVRDTTRLQQTHLTGIVKTLGGKVLFTSQTHCNHLNELSVNVADTMRLAFECGSAKDSDKNQITNWCLGRREGWKGT